MSTSPYRSRRTCFSPQSVLSRLKVSSYQFKLYFLHTTAIHSSMNVTSVAEGSGPKPKDSDTSPQAHAAQLAKAPASQVLEDNAEIGVTLLDKYAQKAEHQEIMSLLIPYLFQTFPTYFKWTYFFSEI
ncbi:hypothetical protein BDR07DRAFT_43300 [Suillus spraguei]|nr:hypothetical protein BDR07DRAFT_43300 [Suillus spraguei]